MQKPNFLIKRRNHMQTKDLVDLIILPCRYLLMLSQSHLTLLSDFKCNITYIKFGIFHKIHLVSTSRKYAYTKIFITFYVLN